MGTYIRNSSHPVVDRVFLLTRDAEMWMRDHVEASCCLVWKAETEQAATKEASQ